MIFDKLATFIIKRHKFIVAFWIIVFLCAVPALFYIEDVIVYGEDETNPLNTKNQDAMEIIKKEFPSLLPSSNAIIVIQGTNLNSSSMKDFLLKFENETVKENTAGKLTRITSVLTLYSVYRTKLLEPVIPRVAPLLVTAEDQVNTTAYMLFELPTQFYLNYSALDMGEVHTGFVSATYSVYHAPSVFIDKWSHTTGSREVRTQTAYDQAKAAVPSSERAYLDAFVLAWNATWSDGTTYATDAQRGDEAVDVAAPQYYGFDIYHLETMEKRELYYASTSLGVSNWTDAPTVYKAEVAFAGAEAGTRAFVYMTPHLNNTLDYATQGAYLEDFLPVWTASFWNPATANLSPLERAEYAKNETIPKLAATYITDATTKELLDKALKTFTLTNWKDKAQQHTFTLDVVASVARDRYNISVPTWFLDQVYAYGPNITSEQTKELARSIVENNTLDTIPVPIPAQILNTFIDSKNETMLAVVGFIGDPASEPIQKNVVELRRLLHSLIGSRPDWKGYKTYLTGIAGIDYDMRSSAEADVKLIEPFTAVLVILFIAYYFRSVVAPWVPLAAVGMAYVMAQAAMYFIGSEIMGGIHYSIRIVVFTMIMGAGADYCIFIISRFREERLKGHSKDHAIRTAVVWAGESITTSGATAILAFSALALFSFPLVRTMGMCLAVALAIMLIMALTLIPAVLYLIGDWIFWPTMGARWEKYKKAAAAKIKQKKGYFFKAAKISLKYAIPIVVVALVVSVPAAYLVFNMKTNYDFLGAMADTEAKQGVNAMGEGFGEGYILPTYVVIYFDDPLYSNETHRFNTDYINATDGLMREMGNLSTVFKVTSSAYNTQSGLRIDRAVNWTAVELSQSLGINTSTVQLTVVFKDQPSSQEAVDAVIDVRDICKRFKSTHLEMWDAGIYIGGTTANSADIGDAVSGDFPLSAALVMVGVYVILLFVLGSVLIPIRLMITILLSIAWTLALAIIIFIWWAGIPILWILPLLLFVILMGLGMDYDIFLMTRVKEEVLKGKSDEEAIAHAVEYTGSIITICGVIMAGAFGTMMLSSMGMLQEFGFGLCFAILIDATIVRIYLVPAIMILLKKWNWWAPFGLQKVKRK